MKLPTAEQMQNLDATAIQMYGIPSIVLMENAGRVAVERMNSFYGDLQGKKVAIVAGPGNNGGDGFVMARHLHQLQAEPVVFCLVAPENLKGDAAINAAIVKKLPINIHALTGADALLAAEFRCQLAESCLIVDAIFGTGLKRQVAGHFAQAIEAMNTANRPLVAVDVPSGLDSDNGKELGVCVHADLTVTFGLAKPGLVMPPGAQFCGRLEIVDIGIPAEAVAKAGIDLELLDRKMVQSWLAPRGVSDHKGSFGHVLLIGGSQGKTGAALLAAKGGLRSGVGLTTLCVPQQGQAVFESIPEVMTLALPPHGAGHFVPEDFQFIREATVGKTALVIGPGLGMHPETAELVQRTYLELEVPMVLDADALNILADHSEIISQAPAPRILTPHPGEMARLSGLSTKEVQEERLAVAVDFARQHQVVTVLKGACTVIAAPDGRTALNPTGNPGMATGGMGDVLAGFMGGLVAQKNGAWEAACLGAYVHGLAADRIARFHHMEAGMLASDVANELPLALQALKSKGDNRDN